MFDADVEQIPIRKGFGEGLVVAGENDERVVALCADLTDSTQMYFLKPNSQIALSKSALPNKTSQPSRREWRRWARFLLYIRTALFLPVETGNKSEQQSALTISQSKSPAITQAYLSVPTAAHTKRPRTSPSRAYCREWSSFLPATR